jgi:hypothetical protein
LIRIGLALSTRSARRLPSKERAVSGGFRQHRREFVAETEIVTRRDDRGNCFVERDSRFAAGGAFRLGGSVALWFLLRKVRDARLVGR